MHYTMKLVHNSVFKIRTSDDIARYSEDEISSLYTSYRNSDRTSIEVDDYQGCNIDNCIGMAQTFMVRDRMSGSDTRSIEIEFKSSKRSSPTMITKLSSSVTKVIDTASSKFTNRFTVNVNFPMRVNELVTLTDYSMCNTLVKCVKVFNIVMNSSSSR